ncbi:MAG: hypothetical protein KGH65_03800 [Candidatus Micrarchaeota archaeon]|nr:hypothetical protein [Candidatus Micrarchaeota archaeon]
MSDDELLQLIAEHEREAMGSSTAQGMTVAPNTPATMTTLELDNYYAWNYYMARPLGNEQPDRSQVVIPVVRDVIEWIVPQLMRVFCSTDRICRFEPDGPQDEELADQQTDACNYIFMRMNDGFNIIHDYIKEALLLRNGYIKTQWVKKREVKIERYTGLSEEALTQLTMDAEEEGDEIEFLGKDERNEISFVQQQVPPQPGQPPMPPQMVPQTTQVYDVKIRRISERKFVEVCAVPRENVLVSPRTRRGLDDSPYYCHKEKLSRSECLELEYDPEIVKEALPGPPRWLNIDDLARNSVIDQLTVDENDADPATQVLEVRDCCVRVDYDGDDIAELRRVVVIGDKIALNEEIEEGDMASGVAIRTPHRHIGISLYEVLKDLQDIKTDLTRQGLDNVWLCNNTRIAVDQDNVNLEDLSTNRPGGIVRTRGGPGDKLLPLSTQNVLPDIMGAIEYVDTMQQWRTGVGSDTTVLNPDELQNVAKGNAMALLSKSELKVEQMARLLGEGIKDAFRKINNLIMRHQDKEMMMQLRGKWVPVDPSLWKTRTAVSVNIGLGSGNREETRANLMVLGQAMQAGKSVGLVGPEQGYNYFRKLAETLGFNSPNEFFVDPQSPEGQQLQKMLQQPPVPLQIAQMKAQSDAQAQQQNTQLQIQKTQAQMQAETSRDMFQAKVNAAVAGQKAQLEAQSKAMQTGGQMQLEREKAILNLAVQLAEAALKANAQPDQIIADTRAAEQAVQ